MGGRGRVRRWLNVVLIHLHNYTADRYKGGGILYCCWVYCIVVGGYLNRGLVWNVGEVGRGVG